MQANTPWALQAELCNNIQHTVHSLCCTTVGTNQGGASNPVSCDRQLELFPSMAMIACRYNLLQWNRKGNVSTQLLLLSTVLLLSNHRAQAHVHWLSGVEN